METIDDYWAQYCATSRHGQSFVEWLQEREVFGFSPHIWQVFHNTYVKYCVDTFDYPTFYEWLKSSDLILN